MKKDRCDILFDLGYFSNYFNGVLQKEENEPLLRELLRLAKENYKTDLEVIEKLEKESTWRDEPGLSAFYNGRLQRHAEAEEFMERLGLLVEKLKSERPSLPKIGGR